MPLRLGSQIVFKRMMTVALLLVVFGLSAIGVAYFALRGRTVEVPSVIGKTEAEAESELDDYGLRMQVKSRAGQDKSPANTASNQYTVSDQDPLPGTTVKTGQLVRVSLSLGVATQ